MVRVRADGVTGITGALAALGEFFTTNQGRQTDCGLDLGWTHPNATVTAKSINNTAECNGATLKGCACSLRTACWVPSPTFEHTQLSK